MRLNSLEFHVELGEGDRDLPPLLLLHGFTGSVRAWDEVRQSVGRSAGLILVDMIGHGATAAPDDASRYTLDWCTRDLLALLDALSLPKVQLLGYSMGGRAALCFACSAPERLDRLILESASPGIEDAAERERRVQSDNALADRIVRDGIQAFVDAWERQPLLAAAPHLSQGAIDRQRAERLRNDPFGLANSLRGMGAGQQQPLWSALPELRLPVQLIVGALDARYRAVGERMQALLPDAALQVVPEAGHTVHLDQPEAFARIVNTFLAQPVKPASGGA